MLHLADGDSADHVHVGVAADGDRVAALDFALRLDGSFGVFGVQFVDVVGRLAEGFAGVGTPAWPGGGARPRRSAAARRGGPRSTEDRTASAGRFGAGPTAGPVAGCARSDRSCP